MALKISGVFKEGTATVEVAEIRQAIALAHDMPKLMSPRHVGTN
jgi:hypothetical protein